MLTDETETRYAALLREYHEDDLAACEAGCLALLEQVPEHFGSLQLLGVMAGRQGRHEQSLAWLTRAVAAQPAVASVHNHRGHVLLMVERHLEALQSYDRAIELGLENPHALNSRGAALQALQRVDAALASYARAIELLPDFAEAWLNRGELLLEIGRRSEAETTLRRARELGSDPDKIEFALSAMGVAPPVRRTPPDFVRRLFDEYAHRFDAHLTGPLAYRVPGLVAAALARLSPAGPWDIVDLGCGTGLCAPHLAPRARLLHGVDLSEAMLARAQALGLYQVLHNAELTEWLRQRPTHYELAVAADVLNYFGELEDVFAAVEGALRPGGHFVFTVEAKADDEGEFNLAASRRFRHTRAYVQRLTAAHGFELLHLADETLRLEGGTPVAGYLATLRKPLA